MKQLSEMTTEELGTEMDAWFAVVDLPKGTSQSPNHQVRDFALSKAIEANAWQFRRALESKR